MLPDSGLASTRRRNTPPPPELTAGQARESPGGWHIILLWCFRLPFRKHYAPLVHVFTLNPHGHPITKPHWWHIPTSRTGNLLSKFVLILNSIYPSHLEGRSVSSDVSYLCRKTWTHSKKSKNASVFPSSLHFDPILTTVFINRNLLTTTPTSSHFAFVVSLFTVVLNSVSSACSLLPLANHKGRSMQWR